MNKLYFNVTVFICVFAVALLFFLQGCLQLPKEDKAYIDEKLGSIETKVGTLTDQIKELNTNLSDMKALRFGIEQINKNFDKAVTAVEGAEGDVTDYKHTLNSLVQQLIILNTSLKEAEKSRHSDSMALLDAIKRLEEKFNNMFGGGK